MAPRNVDEYIATAPASARPKLRAMRRAILEAAPGARESMSCRIPFYDPGGRLAWFGLFRGRIGLYVRPPVLEEHRAELRGYVTKSSLHLPLDGKVPGALVKRLARAAARKKEERDP